MSGRGGDQLATSPTSPTSGSAGRLAAVVVNYNAREELIRCLRSLRDEGVPELIVVDNGSEDGSREAVSAAFPGARLISTGANLGYGAAANRGVAASSADAVLVCNPDVVLHEGALAAMVRALRGQPRRGLVGPAIENEDGSVYPSARTFPSVSDAAGHAFLSFVWPRNRFTRRYRMLEWDHRSARSVDWVSGACFLARREAIDELGGFDESYFMYLEDVDLCWRAREQGWDIVYEPAARVTHTKGVSTDRNPYRMIVAHHRSLLRFSARSTRGWRRALLPLIASGLVVRAGLSCAERAMRRSGRTSSVLAPPRDPSA